MNLTRFSFIYFFGCIINIIRLVVVYKYIIDDRIGFLLFEAPPF